MRIRSRAGAVDRFAIRPYPTELERTGTLPGGRPCLLRPIRAEDEPAIHDMFRRLTPQDVRMRFFAPKGQLSHEAAARMTQIDYDREMALVAVERDAADRETVWGVVRVIADPDNCRAGSADGVASANTGRGAGRVHMPPLIPHA